MQVDDIRPSTYNPRQANPARLDMVELSLKKLGFLSPIFADEEGEIISGHQRHHVAQRMGMDRVPVFTLPVMPDNKRKALNLVFNRATNDMDSDDTSGTLAEAMRSMNVRTLAEKTPDSPDLYRCAKSEPVPVSDLVEKNHGRWVQYAAQVAKTLYARGVFLPIVCTRDNQVVNGIGRLQMAAEKKQKTVPVVYIEDHEADFARAMLNLLSMDFDLHNRYADLLRYGSFRRSMTYRAGLGRGFYVEHFGNITTKVFNLQKSSTLARWRRLYGRSVFDFGAGKFTDTDILRTSGIDVTPFEPFPIGVGGQVDRQKSLFVTRHALKMIASGQKFDSVFISSVLNSVPFRKDREHIAVIASALCGDSGTCYAWTMADDHHNWRAVQKKHRNKKHESLIQFRLDYEPGILIGDLGRNPKVQKYHSSKELYDVFKKAFQKVRVRRVAVDLSCVAKGPVYTQKQLHEAIEFEFNLPYPDGSRMDLVDQAKAAFRERGCLH